MHLLHTEDSCPDLSQLCLNGECSYLMLWSNSGLAASGAGSACLSTLPFGVSGRLRSARRRKGTIYSGNFRLWKRRRSRDEGAGCRLWQPHRLALVVALQILPSQESAVSHCWGSVRLISSLMRGREPLHLTSIPPQVLNRSIWVGSAPLSPTKSSRFVAPKGFGITSSAVSLLK